MTIDEAIEHCENTACRLGFTECGKDHRQLAEWLKELKELREDIQAIERLSDYRYEENRSLKNELDLFRRRYPDRGELPHVGTTVLVCWFLKDYIECTRNVEVVNFGFNKNGIAVWGCSDFTPFAWKYIDFGHISRDKEHNK